MQTHLPHASFNKPICAVYLYIVYYNIWTIRKKWRYCICCASDAAEIFARGVSLGSVLMLCSHVCDATYMYINIYTKSSHGLNRTTLMVCTCVRVFGITLGVTTSVQMCIRKPGHSFFAAMAELWNQPQRMSSICAEQFTAVDWLQDCSLVGKCVKYMRTLSPDTYRKICVIKTLL